MDCARREMNDTTTCIRFNTIVLSQWGKLEGSEESPDVVNDNQRVYCILKLGVYTHLGCIAGGPNGGLINRI